MNECAPVMRCPGPRIRPPLMTSFVTSCLQTTASSAQRAARLSRGQPRAARLVRLLTDKSNILVTAHLHPDPDAMASAWAMSHLLTHSLPRSKVTLSIQGNVGGWLNSEFARLSALPLVPWDQDSLDEFDAIVLLDVQPNFAYSPLPPNIEPTAIIDHHRARGRKPRAPFCDIRTDVGACTSIVFSYLMELDVPIAPSMAASLLYAIETDLAGAAGAPGQLDNVAMSSLTLRADPHKLYAMRHASLPREFYVAMHKAIGSAMVTSSANAPHDSGVLFTFLDQVESPEMPAVVADFMLRYDKADWVLASGVHEGRLVLSLRTTNGRTSAGEMMRRLLRRLGEGGGHRTKAGGFVPLTNGSLAEIERVRRTLRTRLLKALDYPADTRLVKLM